MIMSFKLYLGENRMDLIMANFMEYNSSGSAAAFAERKQVVTVVRRRYLSAA